MEGNGMNMQWKRIKRKRQIPPVHLFWLLRSVYTALIISGVT